MSAVAPVPLGNVAIGRAGRDVHRAARVVPAPHEGMRVLTLPEHEPAVGVVELSGGGVRISERASQ